MERGGGVDVVFDGMTTWTGELIPITCFAFCRAHINANWMDYFLYAACLAAETMHVLLTKAA